MVSIYNETNDKTLLKYSDLVKKYVKKAFLLLKISNKHEFSVIIVKSNRIKELNNKYRNINRTTDVLSFEEYDLDSDDLYLGEIFVNIDRVRSQAKSYKHSIKREYLFLVIHGVLHLCGYDHTLNKNEEKIMFDLQKKILGDLK